MLETCAQPHSGFCNVAELYTVTVLMESALMGADVDGDVLVYLEMAQVGGAVSRGRERVEGLGLYQHSGVDPGGNVKGHACSLDRSAAYFILPSGRETTLN